MNPYDIYYDLSSKTQEYDNEVLKRKIEHVIDDKPFDISDLRNPRSLTLRFIKERAKYSVVTVKYNHNLGLAYQYE